MQNNTAVAIDSIKTAVEHLVSIDVDFDELGIAVIPLQDAIVDLTDSVEKYLSMFETKNKTNPVIGKKTELTKDILIEQLNETITTINTAEEYGLSSIAPKAMKMIKKNADAVYAASVNLIVASIRYKAQQNK